MPRFQYTPVTAKNQAEFDMRIKDLEDRGYSLEHVEAVEEKEHRFYSYSQHGSRLDRKQTGESDIQQKFKAVMKRAVPDDWQKRKGWGSY